jgi:hypothetical protein
VHDDLGEVRLPWDAADEHHVPGREHRGGASRVQGGTHAGFFRPRSVSARYAAC